MTRTYVTPKRLLLVGITLAGALAVGNVFSASNTVPNAVLGEGAGTISGYTVTSVSYTLNSSNPQNIDAVTFTTSALANSVKVKLVAAGSSWYTCSTTNSPTNTNWSCTTTSPQATVSASDELRVVAAQ